MGDVLDHLGDALVKHHPHVLLVTFTNQSAVADSDLQNICCHLKVALDDVEKGRSRIFLEHVRQVFAIMILTEIEDDVECFDSDPVLLRES